MLIKKKECILKRWNSQPTIRKRSVGDYMLSTAVIASGNNFHEISLLAKCMNLTFVSNTTFLRVQKHYALPVVRDFWKEIQQKNIERYQEQKIPILVKGTI